MTTHVDVAIVGFGPAGEVLASLLGQKGHRVVAFDKFPEPYGLPRMSTMDGEIVRVLQTAANAADALRDSIPERWVEVFGADGEIKGHFDWNYKRGGHWSHMSVHQPNIESALEARIASCPNVDVLWGRTVTDITKTPEGFSVTAKRVDGETEEYSATYIVGMDGTHSFVRTELGIGIETLFEHDDRWLLTDYEVVKPLPNDLENRIYVDLDVHVPYFFGPNAAGRVRTDVRMLPGDDEVTILDPELGFRFLEERAGIPYGSVKQTRRKVYVFRSQLATKMRVGNAFIGGDAAHAMTPYMGQGACTAMRDAANLSWKLDFVLRGLADDTLLDTYGPERLSHARFFVEGSLAAYKMMTPTTPEEAAGRDAYIAATGGNVAPPIPPLRDGIQFRTADGEYAPQSGEVAPQGVVTRGDKTGLLDDVVGGGVFQVVSSIPLAEALGAERVARLKELGTVFVELGTDTEDTDGTYAEYFEKNNATTLVSRPDVYVFGIANGEAESVELIDSLLAQVPNSSAALTAA